jgi:predicted XRE-type DNA-binding protein
MPKRIAIRHEESSGNVFADVGLPEGYLAKAELVSRIDQVISERHLTQARAAQIMGVDQPRVSALLHGKLSLFSLEKLMSFVAKLGKSVEIRFAESGSPGIWVSKPAELVVGRDAQSRAASSLPGTVSQFVAGGISVQQAGENRRIGNCSMQSEGIDAAELTRVPIPSGGTAQEMPRPAALT